MTIASNRELWMRVEDLAAYLDGIGASDHATSIRQALGVSSLPGEILGELKLELFRLKSSPFASDVRVAADIDEIKAAIDWAFRPRS